MVGCASPPDDPVRWLEGFRFSWDHFNHRLAHLEVHPDDDVLRAAIVGGTSTTGVAPPPLPEGCEEESCVEYPVTDLALLDVGWARAEPKGTAFFATAVELLLESGVEATALVSADVPRGGRGQPAAIVRGWRLSSDHALSGEPSCYDPAFGWHLQRLAMQLGEPVERSDAVEVELTAEVTPGASLDPARACIDDVVDRAVIELAVEVLFVLAPDDPVREDVHTEASYTWSGNSLDPEAQPEPPPDTYASPFVTDAFGWSAIDFRFDPGEDRGAYLRSLAFEATPTDALGWASNFSPATQLEDFAYTFDGTVTGFDVDGAVSRGTTSASLLPELDIDGTPVVHEVGWGSVRP